MVEISRSREVASTREDRTALKAAIELAIMRWQEATQLFDEAVGERLDLVPAEGHCLALLAEGPQTASAIAQAVGLTPAAVTSLVDRLEARGFVVRHRSETDRRQVLVAHSEAMRKIADRYYGPIAREGAAMLDRLSMADLAVVKRFVTDALDLQQRHIARIRTDRTKPPAKLKPRRG